MLSESLVVGQQVLYLPRIAPVHFRGNLRIFVTVVGIQVVRMAPAVCAPEGEVGTPRELVLQVVPDAQFGRDVGNNLVRVVLRTRLGYHTCQRVGKFVEVRARHGEQFARFGVVDGFAIHGVVIILQLVFAFKVNGQRGVHQQGVAQRRTGQATCRHADAVDA